MGSELIMDNCVNYFDILIFVNKILLLLLHVSFRSCVCLLGATHSDKKLLSQQNGITER